MSNNNIPEKTTECDDGANPCLFCTGEDKTKSDATDSCEESHLYFSSPCLLPEIENDDPLIKWYSYYT